MQVSALGPWGIYCALQHISKNLCVASKVVMLAQPWKSRLSQSFRPVSLKLDDDTMVSVRFLAQRDLSSSAIVVSCLAVIVQEA